MHRTLRLALSFTLLIAPVLAATGACSSSSGTGTDLTNYTGEQLATYYTCATCHGGTKGDYSGGSAAVEGTQAWAPNLTPDMDTGIGSWSEDLIVRAIHQGVDDEGEELCPTMPRFPDMPDEQAKKIADFLLALPAVSNQVADSICPPLKPDPNATDGGT